MRIFVFTVTLTAFAVIAGLLVSHRIFQYQEDRVLRKRLAGLSDGVDAAVGVAVISGEGDTVVFHGGAALGYGRAVPENAAEGDCGDEISAGAASYAFPMMSVFKFHQALAVCDRLRQTGSPLSMQVKVLPEDLEKGTWSPMRDGHPEGGAFTVADLLSYTLVSSDNNACDILFGKVCGIGQTVEYIRSLGIRDFSIECDESMMHEDMANCCRNWSTPLSAAMLLEKFHSMKDIDGYSSFVWDTMKGCNTGQNRIPKYIADRAAAIVHKTGTGDADADGRIIGVNDIGTVLLPDGRHYSIAVFVRDAAVGMDRCEELIARISEAVFDAQLRKTRFSCGKACIRKAGVR